MFRSFPIMANAITVPHLLGSPILSSCHLVILSSRSYILFIQQPISALLEATIAMPSFHMVQDEAPMYETFSWRWKTWAVVAAILTYAVMALWTALRPGLRRIPGPFIARFSRLYLFLQATKGNQHSIYLDLHEKYGKLVRVGPNKVAIADPDMIPIIYNFGSKYQKVRHAYQGSFVSF